MMKSTRKIVVSVASTVAAMTLLSGCQSVDTPAFNTTSSFSLESVVEHEPAPFETYNEQSFETNELSKGFDAWFGKVGWGESYQVDRSPLEWIPKSTESAFSDPISKTACAAWLPSAIGKVNASTTSAYVYRLMSDEGKPATKADFEAVSKKLSSDLGRRGWKSYDTSEFGFAVDSTQRAWYVPPVKDAEYVPVDTYSVESSGEPQVDYISYRVMLADRGNGYATIYISAPCSPVDTKSYDELQNEAVSTELDLVQSDSKNPDNSVLNQ
jgi:hypothetical protein